MTLAPRGRSRRTFARWIARAGIGVAAVAVLSAGSCDKSQSPEPEPDPDPIQVADFSRPDVNSTSPTYNTNVSPRDHLGSISAWYFGHAT